MLSVPFYADLIRCVLYGGPFPDVTRAQSLLLGTVAQESQFTYTRQLGGGPARGYGQIEPQTELSVWQDYLAYNPDISAYVTSCCGHGGPDETALEYDMVYGILLMRIVYFWRDPERLPPVGDVDEAAERYKLYYNTIHGAATEADYVASYEALVQPVWPRRLGKGNHA